MQQTVAGRRSRRAASLLWLVLGAGVVLSGCSSEPTVRDDAGTDAFVPGPSDCAPENRVDDVLLDDDTCAADDEDDDDDDVDDGSDCAPRDRSRTIELADARCVADDADDDDDGMRDEDDCAPRDPSRHVALDDGTCVADDADDDDDGTVDVGDCAPRNAARAIRLVDGVCAADDDDDDDDGVLDVADCAPRDAGLRVTLVGGACVVDDADDDDDGADDVEDCAPLDAMLQIVSSDGCAPDDEDDDDDGFDDAEDCAPLDSARWLRIGEACVADDADDDDDGFPDAEDCGPRDPAIALLVGDLCVADDTDDDDDGAADAIDCAPRDAARWIALVDGACVADDDDDDDDGSADGADCAPRDASRWMWLDPATCVADDTDDDDDGADDGLDCSPRDPRYTTGACDVGEIDVGTCGVETGACSAGTRTRTCLPNCAYAPWSECGGTSIAPIAEVCGDGIDDDCDGEADEGCVCDLLAPGASGSFAVPGNLQDLHADPVRCLLYAFDSRVGPEPSQFVVIDTRLRREVTRIVLGTRHHDFDVAADGSRIVIAHPDRGELWVVTPPHWAAPRVIPVGETFDVAVTTRGFAIITLASRAVAVDLETGGVRYSALVGSSVELALSPDDRTLFVGDVNVRNGSLDRYAVAGDGTVTSTQTGPRGLGNLPRPFLAVSGDGRLVAWSGSIFEASDLDLVHGTGYAWHLDAFDARGSVLAAGGGLIDVGRVRPTQPLWTTNSAVLLSGDEEVWWHDATTGRMSYARVASFLPPATLGRREWPPLALTEYEFVDLVTDPIRPWLYAIDASGEVVVVDRATLAPVAAIEAGLAATEGELDPAGRFLYVGHANTWGVARIDLDDLTYTGLVPTGVQPFQIAVPRAGRVVSVGYQQTDVTLADTFGRAVLATLSGGFYRGALDVAGDGASVYLGDSATSASDLSVLDTSGDGLRIVRQLPFADSVDYASRALVTIPGTREVFWARGRWNTDTLVQSITVPETILTITPDGRLAISSIRIFDATTGAYVATLPVASGAQALSPDGRTLYLGLPGDILAVDLAPYLGAP